MTIIGPIDDAIEEARRQIDALMAKRRKQRRSERSYDSEIAAMRRVLEDLQRRKERGVACASLAQYNADGSHNVGDF